MFDAIAFIIKGALVGALGGLVLPAGWMSLVFGAQPFLRQLSDGSGIFEILTSLVVIPFGTLFVGLVEGGLVTTTLFGAASGAVIGLLVLILRRFATRAVIGVIVGLLALAVAILLAVGKADEMALATGLAGLPAWVLLALYVAAAAWLGWRLPLSTAA
jgi:hypothetical protein